MNTPTAKPADPCVMVIFGSNGDLTQRLLVPALSNLATAGLLAPEFRILGVLHSAQDIGAFRSKVGDSLAKYGSGDTPSEQWKTIQDSIEIAVGEFEDPKLYEEIKQTLDKIESGAGRHGNYLFYLATAPEYFGEIAEQLGKSGLAQQDDGRNWRRLVVEKPFGHDLNSSLALNEELVRVFGEKRIFRIDHYLGKETVQNIMVFRFANEMFEPIWSNQYIDSVQITVSETVGVETRGKFYDATGALRDMLQNHLFQLLSMTAMEAPVSLAADAIRTEKVKVLQSVPTIKPESVGVVAVRGQYAEGDMDGKQVAAYRQEPKVSPESRTETFVALKITVDDWRWGGVPFYLRTGKHLAAKVSEIAIQFKQPPQKLFHDIDCANAEPNWLVLRIQPNEGIFMKFGGKIPGPVMQVGSVEMDFDYAERFGKSRTTGYETLLYDAMNGDQTLFQRADQVDTGWSIVQPIMDAWAADTDSPIPTYASGSWGPKEADELLARDGRAWRRIDPAEYQPRAAAQPTPPKQPQQS